MEFRIAKFFFSVRNKTTRKLLQNNSSVQCSVESMSPEVSCMHIELFCLVPVARYMLYKFLGSFQIYNLCSEYELL